MANLLLAALILLSLIVVGLFVPAVRTRRRLEFRAQILDLLGTATQRGTPLAPLLSRAAEEHKRRKFVILANLAAYITAGDTLSAALQRCAPELFNAHTIAAIRSAEGTALLPSVLRALSRETNQSLSMRHRLYMTMFYPICLGVFLIGMQSFYADLETSGTSVGGSLAASRLATAAVAIMWTALGLLLLYRFVGCHFSALRNRVARAASQFAFTDRMLRLAAGERLLRSVAALVGAGQSLSEAMRGAAASVGNQRMERAALAAAELMDAGGSPEDAWERTMIPTFAAVRAASTAGPPPEVADALDALASECGHRLSAQIDRILNWAQPATIAVFGLVLALQFGAVFQLMFRYQREVLLW